MVRVVSVEDARTITIETDGRRERIELAGVAITDADRAADLLRWTIGSHWVLIEKHPAGGYLVFRSPDALFVNRELVMRGYARTTSFGIDPEPNLNVTYLGQYVPPVSSPSEPRTRSSTDRRSTGAPSRALPKSRRASGSAHSKSPGPRPKAP